MSDEILKKGTIQLKNNITMQQQSKANLNVNSWDNSKVLPKSGVPLK